MPKATRDHANRRSAVRSLRSLRAATRRRRRCASTRAQPRRAARRLRSTRRSAFATRVLPIAHRNAPAAFALDFENTQHAVAGGDVDRVAMVADDLAGRRVRALVERTRGPDAQTLAVDLGFGDGPRIERAHFAFERDRGLLPIQTRPGFFELVRVFDAARRLRLLAQRFSARDARE